jgi:phosphohistidine phosphatase
VQIYLLRHANAGNFSSDGSDAGRELTAQGREILRTVLRRAQGAKVSPGLILTSPFVRAIETAEMAGEILGCASPIERTSALVPSASPYDIWEELRQRREEIDRVLLVSHQPLIGHLVAFLLDSPSLEVEIGPAALAAVREDSTGPEPRGVLQWLLTPALSA